MALLGEAMVNIPCQISRGRFSQYEQIYCLLGSAPLQTLGAHDITSKATLLYTTIILRPWPSRRPNPEIELEAHAERKPTSDDAEPLNDTN